MPNEVSINLTKENRFRHATWDRIREFAKTGAEVKNLTLFNTVNRIEYAHLFWDLYKETGVPRLLERDILNLFKQSGLVLFGAFFDKKCIGLMLFKIDHSQEWLEVDYLCSAIDPNVHISASYAMMYEAISFFKQLGMLELVLGTDEEYHSFPEELLEWKKGFSNMEFSNV